MKITIKTNSQSKQLELDPDTLIEDLKALIEAELGNPYPQQILKYKGIQLSDNKQLKSYNIKDGDIISVESVMFTNFFPNPLNNSLLIDEAKRVKSHYENNPNDLQFILHQNPEFAQAVLSDDISVLAQHIYKQKMEETQKKMQELERISKLNDDPFNSENQRMIEEEIKKKNIQENLEYAQEYVPEVFGHITMLYINISINKVPIQAFVDSGAQSTIMSKGCAEKCGIMRMVDTRFHGTAIGIGQSRIVGRIHAIEMQIMNRFFTCSLTILDDDKVDFLLGLDMLKRHECKIDLKTNKLIFGESLIEVPFLSEGEIKKTLSSTFIESEEKKQIEDSLLKDAIEKSKQGIKEAPKSQIQPQNPQFQQKPQAPKSIYKEEDIKKLTDLSFSREKAILALSYSKGNVEMAASILFSGQLD